MLIMSSFKVRKLGKKVKKNMRPVWKPNSRPRLHVGGPYQLGYLGNCVVLTYLGFLYLVQLNLTLEDVASAAMTSRGEWDLIFTPGS